MLLYHLLISLRGHQLRPTILVHHPPHLHHSPINQRTPCHHFWITLPLYGEPMAPTSRRSLHWAPDGDAAQTIFYLTRGLSAERPLVRRGTIGKIWPDLSWFFHFQLKLLIIHVRSIVAQQDERLYLHKNNDPGQSRATFIFFLACLGDEICRNSRLQFAC